jgi:hypothetical protein
MAASNLASQTTQVVSNFFFNFTEATSLGLLEFAPASGENASIFRGPNLREAGGARFFDIEFVFAAGQFVPGDQSVFLISSLDPLQPITSESFSFLSFSNSPQDTNFYSAALVSGINGGLTSWIAAATAQTPGPGPSPIPEPATMILLGCGLGGVTVFCRKKFLA